MIPSSPTPSYKSFGQSLVIPSKHVIYKKVASDSLKLLKPVLQYFWMKLGKLVSRSKLGSTRLQVVFQTFGGCVTSALLEVDSPSIIPFRVSRIYEAKKHEKEWRFKWQPNGQHPPAPFPCAAQHLRCIPGSRSSSNVTVRKFQRSIKRWEGCRSLRRRRHHPQNPKSLYTPRFCESYKHNPSF